MENEVERPNKPAAHFIYTHSPTHCVGTAVVPHRRGVLEFKVLVPMDQARQQVKKFLETQSDEVAGDPKLVARLPAVTKKVAQAHAKRRLTTAIRVHLGGPVEPHEIGGTFNYARRIADMASRRGTARGARSVARSVSYDDSGRENNGGDDIGAFGFLKKIGKGIGKGVKAVGKGVGKGVVKGAKFTGKAAGKVVSNPITSALLTVVPGGSAAAAIINAAKGGSKGAQQAIDDVNAAAAAGDPTAIASAAALARANNTKIAMIAAGGVAMAGLAFLMLRKGSAPVGRLAPLPAV